MTERMLFEASGWRQYFAMTIDTLIGGFGVFLPFMGAQILLPDFPYAPIIVWLTMAFLLFVRPALKTGGSTYGAQLMKCRLLFDGSPIPAWACWLRGLLYFPIFLMPQSFTIPLNLFLDRGWPYDPVFRLRLMSEERHNMPRHQRNYRRQKAKEKSVLFGIKVADIAALRADLEAVTGEDFDARESSYSGDYFLCRDWRGWALTLTPNLIETEINATEEEPEYMEPAYQEYTVLLAAYGTGSKPRLINTITENTSLEFLK